MEVITSVRYIVLLLLSTLPVGNGHGMMIEPAMRSSLWRFNYPGAERNYNDNGINCGGFTNQHERQNGKCGVCGDPNQGPRDNEAGGKYAKGIIARTYKSGQYITVVSDITANHGGFIELKLCPQNNFRVPVTQQCLNQHILPIKGHGTRYYLTSKQKSDFKIHHTAKLPDFVTCRQCVLQWYWRAGQHNGIDPITKRECMGCGKQEEFINCADIAITDEFGMFPSITTAPPLQVTTPFSMYDTFMYQNPEMFPDYFDEYSPNFNQPSPFSDYQSFFTNNRPGFRQQTRSPFMYGGNMQQNRQHNVNSGNMHSNMPPNRGFNANAGFNERYSNVPRDFQQSRGLNRNKQGRYKPVNIMQQRGKGHVQRMRPYGNHINNNRNNVRPIISRNNRPHVNIHVNMRPNAKRGDNAINNKRHNKPLIHRNKILPPDDSEASNDKDDLIDDEDIIGNAEFWNDFNKLLNMSSPDNKEALYEIAEDAENIDELHQNIKFMLQMQNSDIQSIDVKDSDSDESLDMDWLLNEAKDIELDSEEQSLLGLNKKAGHADDIDIKKQTVMKDKSQINNGAYNSFYDENRILDDSDSGGSFSDGLRDSDESKSLNPKYSFDGDSDITKNVIEDYDDSEDSNVHSEMKVDNHFNKMSHHAKKSFKKIGESQRYSSYESKEAKRVNPWNEKSLYKFKAISIDYDDNDVDMEGDNQVGHQTVQKVQTTIETTPSKDSSTNVIDVNYFESDTRDYSDSEVQNNEDNTNEIDKSWEDETEEKDDVEKDSWSYETVPDVEAGTIVVTAQNKKFVSEEVEHNENENKISENDGNKILSAKGHSKESKSHAIKDGNIEKENEQDETQKVSGVDTETTGNDDIKQTSPEIDNAEGTGLARKLILDEVPVQEDAEDLTQKGVLDGDLQMENSKKLEEMKTNSFDAGSTNEAMSEMNRGLQEEAMTVVEEGGLQKETMAAVEEGGLQKYAMTTIIEERLQNEASAAVEERGLQKEGIDKLGGVYEGFNKPIGNQHRIFTGSQIGVPEIQAVPPANILDDSPMGSQHFDFNNMGPSMGQKAESRLFQSDWNSPTSMLPDNLSQMKNPETILHNVNDHQYKTKSKLSKLRRKIQDKISESMSGKGDSDKQSIMSLKLTTGTKKELSPNLSKLVLKMFMNTKSEMPSCSGGLQSVCNPVKLWSKYQQVAEWCTSLCPYGNCPSAVCLCTCDSKPNDARQKKCRAQRAFQEKSGELDLWCEKNCSAGDCPDLLCVCT